MCCSGMACGPYAGRMPALPEGVVFLFEGFFEGGEVGVLGFVEEGVGELAEGGGGGVWHAGILRGCWRKEKGPGI